MNSSMSRFLRSRERLIHVSRPLLPVETPEGTTVMVPAPGRSVTAELGAASLTSTRYTDRDKYLRSGQLSDRLYNEEGEEVTE